MLSFVCCMETISVFHFPVVWIEFFLELCCAILCLSMPILTLQVNAKALFGKDVFFVNALVFNLN
jgi:hypothetical protein